MLVDPETATVSGGRYVTYEALQVALADTLQRLETYLNAELRQRGEEVVALAEQVEALGRQVAEFGAEVDKTLNGLARAWASPTEET